MHFTRNIEDYPEGIVIPVDKPYRWTSADIVGKIKWTACRHFGSKKLKVGHAGTLDPLATGILLVCIGPACRKADELQKSPKEYLAGISFGATTASCDLEKEIQRTASPDISEAAVRRALDGFLGEKMQIAPLFSAKSVDGVRAYELARTIYREGGPMDDSGILQANPVTFYSLELESFGRLGEFRTFEGETVFAGGGLRPNPRIKVSDVEDFKDLPTALVRVGCSKGTYIRSFARDLGEVLGTGALLTSLRRVGNGGFRIEEALSLDKALSLFE